jgi:hypothetical protein
MAEDMVQWQDLFSNMVIKLLVPFPEHVSNYQLLEDSAPWNQCMVESSYFI